MKGGGEYGIIYVGDFMKVAIIDDYIAEPFDTVFLDVEMLEISGIEIGEKIRKINNKTVRNFKKQ